MVVMGAVGEVEAHGVDAGAQERLDALGRGSGRAKGGDDLGRAHRGGVPPDSRNDGRRMATVLCAARKSLRTEVMLADGAVRGKGQWLTDKMADRAPIQTDQVRIM